MTHATDDQGPFPTGFYQVKTNADMKTQAQIIPKIKTYDQILGAEGVPLVFYDGI